MKKRLIFGIVLPVIVLVTACITVMISANDIPLGGTVTPQNTVCEQCGPYTLRCTEVRRADDIGWHSFSYGGYSKTCYYGIRQVYTSFTCNKCGSKSVFENTFHSHGEYDHTPSECGRANTHICYLDGTSYEKIPEELIPFEISPEELQRLKLSEQKD